MMVYHAVLHLLAQRRLQSTASANGNEICVVWSRSEKQQYTADQALRRSDAVDSPKLKLWNLYCTRQ